MKGRALLRIARWEITAGSGGIDRRAVIAAGLALLLIGGLVPVLLGGGASPSDGIFRAGATETPYVAPLLEDGRFVVMSSSGPGVEDGSLDLFVDGSRWMAADDRTGKAAAGAFSDAVSRYNNRLMHEESDQAAAFPVSVELRYIERDIEFIRWRNAGEATDSESEDRKTGSTSGSSGGTSSTESSERGSQPGTGVSGSDVTSGSSSRSPDGDPSTDTTSSVTQQQSVGGTLLSGRTSGSPADISPPFPFVSLVLAFMFVVPMNFVIQAYASSIRHERTNRRGELLLIAPVSTVSIVAGKTLPYFLFMLGIAGVTAVAIGGGLVSVVAVIPVALLFLACAFISGLLSRSHKELTFVLVTVSVVVTSYVFVPAIFTQVHPIAAISPLTLVVNDLEGAAVSAGTIAFSTVPVAVAATTLYGLGMGLYREEDLFAQRPIPAKILDALANPIRNYWSAGVLSAVSIPFVFVAELLTVAVLFVLPLSISLPILFVLVAVIEEIAKSLHVYAGFHRGRYETGLRSAVLVGAASGTGFFVAEKLTAVAQVVGLSDLPLGRVAFELGAGVGGSAAPVILVGLLLAPLALHIGTASITAVGAKGTRWTYVLGLIIAVVVHVGYNLVVVTTVG